MPPACGYRPSAHSTRHSSQTPPEVLLRLSRCTALLQTIYRGSCLLASKALALIWCRALTWSSSPAPPFAALDVPLLVTRQQGSPSPACRQFCRARNACAGGSMEHGTKLKHGTKLEPTLSYAPLAIGARKGDGPPCDSRVFTPHRAGPCSGSRRSAAGRHGRQRRARGDHTGLRAGAWQTCHHRQSIF